MSLVFLTCVPHVLPSSALRAPTAHPIRARGCWPSPTPAGWASRAQSSGDRGAVLLTFAHICSHMLIFYSRFTRIVCSRLLSFYSFFTHVLLALGIQGTRRPRQQRQWQRRARRPPAVRSSGRPRRRRLPQRARSRRLRGDALVLPAAQAAALPVRAPRRRLHDPARRGHRLHRRCRLDGLHRPLLRRVPGAAPPHFVRVSKPEPEETAAAELARRCDGASGRSVS